MWLREKWGRASVLETHFKFTKLLSFSLSISPLSLTFMLSFSIIDAQWSRVNEWKLWWEFCDYKRQQCYLRYWKLMQRVWEWKIIIISTWVRELKAKERERGWNYFELRENYIKNAGEKSIKPFSYFIIRILFHPHVTLLYIK